MSKVETGVMVMYKGKAWGTKYEDGQSTAYGWIEPEDAPIHNPMYCANVTDVTYPDFYDMKELKKGKLVKVRRVTTVEVFA